MSQQVFKTKADMVCPILALPVEIGRQVIQNLDSIAELHALSLSCKAFKEITRERIFAHITFTLPFPSKFCRATEWAQETRLRGLSKMVVQTKYIQTLSVLPQSPVEPNEVTFPPNMQEILAEWMRRMTKLGKLVIENVNLSEQLILTILDITSQQPLSLQLRRCPFSGPLLQMPSIPLHIPTLDIQGYSDSVYWDRPIDVYTPIEEQSIAVAGRLLVRAQLSITALRVDWNSPLSLIEMLGGIFLPSLRAFHWNFLLYVDEQLSTVMDGFLQRHPTIISISLAGEEYSHIPFSFPSLSLVSPSLPNLEIVKTTSNFIHQLVPARPVTSICVTCVEPSGFTTAVQSLSLSTATITKASLIFSEGSESWEHVVESLAEATPSLQELNLRTTSPSFGTDHPALAYQPLRFHMIARLPHLRFLTVDYSRNPSKAVLGMYPSSFMRDELVNLRSTTLQEIAVHGHPRSSQELMLCQVYQGSWTVRTEDSKIVVESVPIEIC